MRTAFPPVFTDDGRATLPFEMNKLSRRQVLGLAAAVAVAPVLPASSSEPQPVGDDAKAIAEVQQARRARTRFPLPENSEPCFVFRAMPAEVRK